MRKVNGTSEIIRQKPGKCQQARLEQTPLKLKRDECPIGKAHVRRYDLIRCLTFAQLFAVLGEMGLTRWLCMPRWMIV